MVEQSKVIRLVEYLTRLAQLRTRIIRNVSEFQNVLWIKDIPKQQECFTQAWGPDEDFDKEQLQIVEKIRTASGVLVQGPPGTGKSHTIANLICHLLATGQRTLITAKTPRALQVLGGLLPDEVRPLCINLLGGGLEEKRSSESSVGGILGKDGGWNADRAASEIKNLTHWELTRERKTLLPIPPLA